MFWTITIVLVVLWLLGLVGGSMIHALLAIAAVVLVFYVITSRRITS